MPSNPRKQLEEWLKKIDVPAGSKVLDVGGSQKSIVGRIKSWGADVYKVLDLPKPHEEHVPVDIKGDIQEVMFNYPDGIQPEFDIVFCLEVTEYWFNPLQALDNIKGFLLRGGILYISFNFVYPHHNPADADFLRYTRAGAVKLLDEAGFGEIEVTTRVDESKSLVKFYDAEGMRRALGDPENPINHHAVGWLVKCKKL